MACDNTQMQSAVVDPFGALPVAWAVHPIRLYPEVLVFEFKKILVPMDASDLSQRALGVALSVAEKFQSDLIVVWSRLNAAALQGTEADEDLRALEHEFEGLRGQVLAKLQEGYSMSPDKVRVEVRAGPPVQTIVDAAAEEMVDLIVMGTHGRTGLTEIFTGSMTERVAAQTSASVLAVKPTGFPFLRD